MDIRYPIMFAKNSDYRDVLVCGIQRSGSTLLFNLVSEILWASKGNIDSFFSTQKGYNKITRDERSMIVRKTHSFFPVISKRVKSKKTIAFFSHRDIRDIVTSAIQKGMISDLDEWLEKGFLYKWVNDSILYCRTEGVVFVSYDDLVNNAFDVVDTISHKLDIPLDDSKAEAIVSKHSISAVKNRLANLTEGKRLNVEDQYHKNHIADARIGKWKGFLSNLQERKILEIASDYQKAFGYS